MSGLFRRIPSIVFAVLFALVAVEARAGDYLFRLSGQEIDDTMSHYYPKGYDRDAVHRQLTAPFDCRNFGDLCREVGEDYAYRLVETVWARARRRMPIESIDRAARQELEAYTLRWFERLYPDGVPERDDYWGSPFAEPGAPAACVDTAFRDSGDFRIVQTSRRIPVAPIVWGRIKVEHFRKNLAGKYKRHDADLLEVEGRAFIQEPDFDPVETPLFNIREDAKQVGATAFETAIGLVRVPFVEGCGGDSNNSALFACTCSGEVPFGF